MSGRVLDKLSRLVRVFDIFEKARKLELPWIIMYSGGKDSTLVLHLAASYALVMGLEKPVYVVYNESYLDPPPVRNWIYRHLSAVSEWSEETGIPFRVVVIEPPPGKDFFSLVFERGYAFPRVRRHAPWCTKEMKTRPTARFFRSKGLRKVV